MVDDHSDILGGHLQKVPPAQYKAWMAENPTTTAAIAVVFSLFAYFILIPAFSRWQDRRYRKALRRRYGIPDDDERPFAIAYAAARTRSGEGSEEGSREVSEQPDDGRIPSRRGHPDAPMLVRLDGGDMTPSHEPEVPRSATHAPNVSQYDPSQVVYNAWQTGPSATLPGEAGARDYIQVPAQRLPVSSITISPGTLSDDSRNGASPPALKTHGKHARDDDETEQPEKKSRLVGATVQVDEGVFIDGEEVHDGMDVDVEVSQPKRGAKRQANNDEDEGIEHVRENGRDKRARKVSREQAPEQSDEEMGAPAESGDEVPEMVPLQRGKKRDRDEAGSTFGGDESVIDEAESDDGHKSRRRRKRRTMAKNIEDATRGQKRSRDEASEESDEEPDRPKRRDTRGQRGNRDFDVFDAPLSNDPLCKGRRIGEEWEINGIHFKVGPNGQRLRQELVKRSRTRFPMPKDSAHPDRRANIDVYVEAWLTDEEYQSAKEHGDLAWQDSPIPSTPDTPGDVSDYHSGKSLLWAASSTPDSPAPQRGPFRQSIVTNVGLRFDPFGQSQLPPRRRVTSLTQATPPVSTSPEPSPSKPAVTKTYSKWEKQDLEAAAMTKLRERRLAEAREAARTATPTPPPPQITFQPAAAAPAPAPSATTASAQPSVAFPKPAEKPAQPAGDKPAGSFAFGAPPVPAATASSGSSSTPASTAPAPAKEAPKNFFSIAPSSNSSATPSTQPASSSSIPNFFANAGKTAATASAQPSQGSTQTQTAPAAPTTSAFSFAKPASTIPSSGSAPSANPFGGAGNMAQPSANTAASSAPKSAFSFAPSTTAPTAASTNVPAEKPAATSASTTTAATPSLLARLGPQVQQATQQPISKPAAGSTTTAAPPKFSFAQPSGPASSGSTLQSAFAQPSAPASAAPASSAPASTPAASSSTGAAPAKFSFGFTGGAKPASATPATAFAANTPASSAPAAQGGATNQGSAFSFNFGVKPSTAAGPASGDAPKPFGGFGMPGQTASSTTPAGAKTPAAFGFGAPTSTTTPASSSAFGASSMMNNTSTTTPSKPPGFSAFSTTPAGAPPNANAFGGNAANSSSTAAPKSAFSFGSTGGTSAFGATGASSTQSSAPSPFGAAAGGAAQPTPNNAQGQSKPSFSFNFGPAPATSSTTASSAPAAQPGAAPVFGATSQPPSNPFNFGITNTSSSAPSAFNFGAAPNTNQNQKQ